MYEYAILVKETKYPNKCDFCKEWIPAKSPSYWDKMTKKNWHTNCYEENVKPKPSPSTVRKAVEEKASEPLAEEESPKVAVARMLKEAIVIIKNTPELKGVEGYAEYPILLAETMKQLGSLEISNKIQEFERWKIEQQRRPWKS